MSSFHVFDILVFDKLQYSFSGFYLLFCVDFQWIAR